MSLTTTTLSAALTASGQSIVVASASGFAAGSYVKIDQEFVRVAKSYVSGTTIPLDGRGLNGTIAAAHVSGANVVVGVGSDFANPSASVVAAYPLAGLRRKLLSYSASGAIDLPVAGEDLVVILNGTSVLAMTVAVPTKDIDGCLLWVASNGVAAHTVTFTGGLSGAGTSYDVFTVNSGAPVLLGPFMAVNGLWQAAVAIAATGTVTNLTAGIA